MFLLRVSYFGIMLLNIAMRIIAIRHSPTRVTIAFIAIFDTSVFP